MRPWLSLILSLLMAPAFCAAKEANPLVGKWEMGNEFQKTMLSFLPDGRYFTETDTVGVKTANRGTYVLKDDTMTAKDATQTIIYQLTFKKNHMTMVSDAAGTTQWTKIAGSEKSVIEEFKQKDAAAAAEDGKWLRRIPTAKVEPGVVPEIGDMPADTKSDDYFKDATVFAPGQGYVWFGTQRYTIVQGPDPGNGQSQCKYFFYGTGRVFARNISYTSGASDRVSINTIQKWGKYRITGDPKAGESVEIIFDDGEKETDTLQLGRRALVGQSLTLNNVKSEQLALGLITEADLDKAESNPKARKSGK